MAGSGPCALGLDKQGPLFLFSNQGLFARRRQLLLTEGPHLYYVDPVNKVLKGEIPWSQELRPEAKNFKTFFVHTVSWSLWVLLCRAVGGLYTSCPKRPNAVAQGGGWCQGSCLPLSLCRGPHDHVSILSWAGRPVVLVLHFGGDLSDL